MNENVIISTSDEENRTLDEFIKKLEENAKKDENGVEYWSARDLQKILEYSRWDDFVGVINKAKISCEASKQKVAYHFEEFLKMVKAGVSSVPTKDFKLTRYACYLIAQNADAKKKLLLTHKHIFLSKQEDKKLTI